jgi:hypothetical protein
MIFSFNSREIYQPNTNLLQDQLADAVVARYHDNAVLGEDEQQIRFLT